MYSSQRRSQRTFTSAFLELEECLLQMQMVNGPQGIMVMRPTRGEKKIQLLLAQMCFSLGSNVLLLTLALLNPSAPPGQCGLQLWMPLKYCPLNPAFMEATHNESHNYTLWSSLPCFQSWSFFLVWRILFHIPASQHPDSHSALQS